jgi:pyridoxamine 5'-phosphate oxidase
VSSQPRRGDCFLYLADWLVTRATPVTRRYVKLLTVGDNDRVADMRRVYRQGGLSESDLAGTWWQQFGRWFAAVIESGLLVEPNAMVLATAGPDGRPGARTVLMREYDERGFVFYTNYRSRKGRDLAANPHAALVFGWLPLERQVVVRGEVERISRAETVSYFASRPYGSRLAAWASPQSAVIPSRQPLEEAVAEAAARWPEGGDVPPPEHWGGFRVIPEMVEFWQGRPDRLHDRLQYRRLVSGEWVVERLAP